MLKCTLRNLIFGLVGAIFVSAIYRSILMVNMEGIITFVTADCAGFISGFLLYETEDDPKEFRKRIDQARMLWLCTGLPALIGVVLFGILGLSVGLLGGLMLGYIVVYLIEAYYPTFFEPREHSKPHSTPTDATLSATPIDDPGSPITPRTRPSSSSLLVADLESIAQASTTPTHTPGPTSPDKPSGTISPPVALDPSTKPSNDSASPASSPRLSVLSSTSSGTREGDIEGRKRRITL